MISSGQGREGFDFRADAPITLKDNRKIDVPILATAKNGKQFAVGLSAPLAINYPDAASLRGLRETSGDIPVIVINELLVRGNLPREIFQHLHD
jgi:hypothetical protein